MNESKIDGRRSMYYSSIVMISFSRGKKTSVTDVCIFQTRRRHPHKHSATIYSDPNATCVDKIQNYNDRTNIWLSLVSNYQFITSVGAISTTIVVVSSIILTFFSLELLMDKPHLGCVAFAISWWRKCPCFLTLSSDMTIVTGKTKEACVVVMHKARDVCIRILGW